MSSQSSAWPAHWRYKEAGNSNGATSAEEQRVAWLRQLLAWGSDMQNQGQPEGEAVLDDHIYALTPQGRVVELPRGGTPVDFAYAVHTQLGHRTKGAKVDGVLVPLNTKLETGQTVEIIAAKVGQPSRDWLSAEKGFGGQSAHPQQGPPVVQRPADCGAHRPGPREDRQGACAPRQDCGQARGSRQAPRL